MHLKFEILIQAPINKLLVQKFKNILGTFKFFYYEGLKFKFYPNSQNLENRQIVLKLLLKFINYSIIMISI